MKNKLQTLKCVLSAVISVMFFTNMLFAQGTWSTLSSTGFHARGALTADVVGGKIYTIGGATYNRSPLPWVEVFEPAVQTWTSPTATGIFKDRSFHSSAVIGDKIYIFGGKGNPMVAQLSLTQVFDPATSSWTTPTITDSLIPREDFTSSVVNGKIYVFGGAEYEYYGADPVLSTTNQVFDPSTNTWSKLTTTGKFTPRAGLSSCVVGGKIYVMGGYDSSYTVLGTLEMFDPATNTWSSPSTTGTFTSRAEFAAEEVNGKIYTMGGIDGINYLNTVEVFDPATNVWSTPVTTGSITKRACFASVVINNKIYALAGYDASSTVSTVQVFDPSLTGIESINSAISSIEIFPNPSNGLIKIQSASKEITHVNVRNILGETVLEIVHLYQSEISIDISSLPAGIYYASIASDNEVEIRKILKQ